MTPQPPRPAHAAATTAVMRATPSPPLWWQPVSPAAPWWWDPKQPSNTHQADHENSPNEPQTNSPSPPSSVRPVQQVPKMTPAHSKTCRTPDPTPMNVHNTTPPDITVQHTQRKEWHYGLPPLGHHSSRPQHHHDTGVVAEPLPLFILQPPTKWVPPSLHTVRTHESLLLHQ